MRDGSHCDRPVQAVEVKRTKIQALGSGSLPCRSPQKHHSPYINGYLENWTWDSWAKSPEVWLKDEDHLTAHFHPHWSNGTAAVRGTKPLNYGVHYWEVEVSHRVFGTSMMFGLCTKNSRLHVNGFTNVLGEDKNSWGLSHKGFIWNDGQSKRFTAPFRENVSTTIGMLFDWYRGTLRYFKDGVELGVAFRGINIQEDLYPVCASTAAKTEMKLVRCIRGFDNLQDRCRAVIAQYCRNNDIDELPLPPSIRRYIKEVLYGP